MRYDGSNPLHAQQARSRLEKMIREGRMFDLTEKKPQRTLRQNDYLHAALAYFASQYGETASWVKEEYFKKLVNPGTFIRERDDKFLGRTKHLRSSADLTTEEMSLCIERFRDWAAREAGIYIPSPEESRMVSLMEMEAERARQYL